MTYKTKTASEQPETMSPQGQANVLIEENNQQMIATSEDWHIAKKLNIRASEYEDSRAALEAMGFTITGETDLFYICAPLEGWYKETNGYWTTVFDASGAKRFMQFYKGAWYDERAFIRFDSAASNYGSILPPPKPAGG